MRRWKRWTACMMATAMVGSLLAGCGSKETTQTQAGTTVSDNTEAGSEPVQMSWLTGQTSAEVDDDAEVVKMIEERFNIDLKGFYVDSSNFEQNLNVKFAGGEMPDVLVVGTSSDLAKYVEGGIIAELPVETIREKAPNFAKCADENNDGTLWSSMIYKGKNYGVANPMSVVPMAMFWNQNWLDKLGLEVPETLEEYEEVLTAFVEQDPDGNGKKDTAGMAERAIGAVFGAFGLRCMTGGTPGFLVHELQLGEDNVPFFPYIRPEAKQALEVLNRWYQKGIIDKEFITGENHGGYAWLSHSFMNGQIGLTSAMPYHYLNFSTDVDDVNNQAICLKEMKAVDPDAKIVAGPAPVGPNGDSGTEAWSKVGRFTCLTTQGASDPRKVDAFLAILDAYYSDPAFMELSNFGLEGKQFNKVGEARVRIGDGVELRKQGVMQVDFGDTILYGQTLNAAKVKNGLALTGNGYYRFNAPATEEFSNVSATLKTLTEQAYYDMITGAKPLDYFDTFVADFKAAGGEAAEQAIQKAYAEQLAAVQK
ncbi:extracellular solute-binding protein [Lacrimispora brassicae]